MTNQAAGPLIHYVFRGLYNGCEDIRKGQSAPTFGALHATDDPKVHRAEAGFLFTTEDGVETCQKCRGRS